LKELIFDGDAV